MKPWKDRPVSELVQLQPADEHNQNLAANVHPVDWVNPAPASCYNLVVVGAGTAGLVAAAGAAGLGAKVALVERELMGGDCLNVGCVPSKGLISAARIAAKVRDAGAFGILTPGGFEVDFSAVMCRMRKLRAEISPNDSAARFRGLGIDVFLGNGVFTSANTVEVTDYKLTFRKAVIATGARAAQLPIPGLAEVAHLTNESLFSLTELPRRLIVIGGGPIGAEMAQSFARFGSAVTLIDVANRILSREEPDAGHCVQRSLEHDGVELALESQVVEVRQEGEEKVVVVEQSGARREVRGDQLLVAIGRAPNVAGLGLEQIGVEFDHRTGVTVNDRLQTTQRNIFAAGDVCSPYKFTHAADFMARVVIENALFGETLVKGRAKASALTIPWCTYTSPEVARVGLNEEEAKQKGIEVDAFVQPLAEVDRAILEGETDGYVKIVVRKGTDQIVGATIVAANAGEMIGEVTMAMTHGLGLGKIAGVIQPYPTQAEAIRRTGDQFNRTRLTPRVKSILEKWLAWRR